MFSVGHDTLGFNEIQIWKGLFGVVMFGQIQLGQVMFEKVLGSSDSIRIRFEYAIGSTLVSSLNFGQFVGQFIEILLTH